MGAWLWYDISWSYLVLSDDEVGNDVVVDDDDDKVRMRKMVLNDDYDD